MFRSIFRSCVLASLVFTSFDARIAQAFCRTTTCDPQLEPDGCDPVQNCPTRGQSLFWPDACVTYAVQRDGSRLREVSAFDLDQAMRKAFAAWLGTECEGGGKPSIGVIPLGGATCDQVEFNPPELGRAGALNANIVMFRDHAWPYADELSVIARTSLTFDPNTGAIFDADIEINSFQNEFSTADTDVSNDLQAVLTHEVGHFLGLDHSSAEAATMAANYDLSNLGVRTLSNDDRSGICSIYSPIEGAEPGCPNDTSPHHGFSRDCGSDVRADASCLALAPGMPRDGLLWLQCVALALFALWQRRAKCPR
jgi:hypothetical protein